MLLAVLPLCAVAVLLSHVARAPEVTLTVEDGLLRIRQGVWDGIYCLTRGLDLPFESVEGVAVEPKRTVPATGLRPRVVIATPISGVVQDGRALFRDLRRGRLRHDVPGRLRRVRSARWPGCSPSPRWRRCCALYQPVK